MSTPTSQAERCPPGISLLGTALPTRYPRSMHVPAPSSQCDAAEATASVHTLFPSLYVELRRLARSRLAGGARPTLLDTSALVHEAYMRMQKGGGVEVRDREHFLAYAAT